MCVITLITLAVLIPPPPLPPVYAKQQSYLRNVRLTSILHAEWFKQFILYILSSRGFISAILVLGSRTEMLHQTDN